MTTYSPILRKSAAEINALSKVYLDSNNKSQSLLPVIQYPLFPDISDDKEKFLKITKNFGSYLKKNIGTHKFILSLSPALDELANDNEIKAGTSKSITALIIDDLKQNNLNYTLIVNYDTSDWILKELSQMKLQEIWISFLPYTFSGGADNLVIEGTYKKFNKLFSNCRINFQADFYTDLSDPARIHGFIKKLTEYKTSVMFTSTSCPANANNVPHSRLTLASPRNDLSLFKNMQSEFTDLIFSDYTVRLKPEPSDADKHDINMNNTYLKFFYTSDDSYYIGKSGLFKEFKAKQIQINSTNRLHKNAQEICSDIVNSPIYDGANFSYGDNRIYKVSQGVEDIKNHYTPILIGINHHITHTLNQL
ncbi:hypothetical protein D5S09_14765 [Lactobacillus sp. LMY-20]|nr:hypothetical protein [Lactobacillus sp. LMY-20]